MPKISFFLKRFISLQYEIKPGTACALCKEYFHAFRENDGYPCRICNDVFHKECLQKCGDLHSSDLMNLEMAKTNIGWSCPICVSTQYGAPVGHLILHVPIFSVAGINIDMLQLLPNINLTLTIIMKRASCIKGLIWPPLEPKLKMVF